MPKPKPAAATAAAESATPDTTAPAAPASQGPAFPRPLPPSATSPILLGQNYPNPFVGETTVPFTLPFAADVLLTLLDPQGRKVAGIVRKGSAPGPQVIKLNLLGLDLPPGNYVYELQSTSRQGIFRQSRLMTSR